MRFPSDWSVWGGGLPDHRQFVPILVIVVEGDAINSVRKFLAPYWKDTFIIQGSASTAGVSGPRAGV